MRRRVRWGNVIRVAATVLLAAIVVAWPRLAPPAPVGDEEPVSEPEPRWGEPRDRRERAPRGRGRTRRAVGRDGRPRTRRVVKRGGQRPVARRGGRREARGREPATNGSEADGPRP